ncbi:hypothetical protein MHH56_23935 [Paenibacillus sp. FSL K6-3182]|uniref:hypothetical protein n=1 Tax=Paenibacillus sp. FSL K6-3182 TaxID=2921495 RepID=UPI0030D23CCE
MKTIDPSGYSFSSLKSTLGGYLDELRDILMKNENRFLDIRIPKGSMTDEVFNNLIDALESRAKGIQFNVEVF